MSGGHFDYHQYQLQDIADSIERYVDGEELDDDEVDDIVNSYWEEEEAKKYVKKHHHSVPNSYGYSKDTIKEFKTAIELLKLAGIYAQRIDWLLSGDDGEESFHERLAEDIEDAKLTIGICKKKKTRKNSTQ